MTKGYWVVHLDVHDKEGHAIYAKASTAAVQKFGGRFLVRAGEFEQVEGAARKRHVVVEFASYEDALSCYRSPEYSAARQLREHTSVADFTIVAGA